MKIPKTSVCVVMLVFVLAVSAQAQTQLVVQKAVILSRSLSGHVNIGLEKVVGNGVIVELCRPDWKTVQASTETDDNGYFSFKLPVGKVFYLRFSSPGVMTFEVRVRLSNNGAADLDIHLIVAT